MKKAGIEQAELSSKEDLALNNGTPVMTAIASLAIHDSENIIRQAIINSSLVFEALRAKSAFLNEGIHEARPHKGQIVVAKNLRKMLQDSRFWILTRIRYRMHTVYEQHP